MKSSHMKICHQPSQLQIDLMWKVGWHCLFYFYSQVQPWRCKSNVQLLQMKINYVQLVLNFMSSLVKFCVYGHFMYLFHLRTFNSVLLFFVIYNFTIYLKSRAKIWKLKKKKMIIVHANKQTVYQIWNICPTILEIFFIMWTLCKTSWF